MSTTANIDLDRLGDLRVLVEDYKTRFDIIGWKDKAWLEKRIWDAIPIAARGASTAGDGRMRGRLLAELLERGSPNEYTMRFTLLQAYTHADLLWPRIDAGLSFYTALQTLRDARVAADRNKTSVPDEIAKILDEPGVLSTSVNGKTFKRRNPTQLKSIEEIAAEVAATQAAPVDIADARSVWPQVRTLLAGHVAERLKGTDPLLAENLWREFETDLKSLVDQMAHKLSRVAKQAQEDTLLRKDLSPGKIRQACTMLSMDPPRPGKPADLKVAKKQKQRLVKLYHPDINQGNEALRPQYEAVLDAYLTLETYNVALSRDTNGVRNG